MTLKILDWNTNKAAYKKKSLEFHIVQAMDFLTCIFFIMLLQVAEMYRNQDSVKNSAAPTNLDEDDFY
jgi:hypothetical protein